MQRKIEQKQHRFASTQLKLNITQRKQRLCLCFVIWVRFEDCSGNHGNLCRHDDVVVGFRSTNALNAILTLILRFLKISLFLHLSICF